MLSVPMKVARNLRFLGLIGVLVLLATTIAKMADLPIDIEAYDIITSGQLTHQSTYTQIFKMLSTVKPGKKCPSKLDHYLGNKAVEKFATDKDFVFTRNYLTSLLQVNGECLEELNKSHGGFVKFLQTTDIQFGDLSSVSGNGVVMVGGGKFNILTLLNTQWLRLLKSGLPIEIFIGNKEEYDPYLCDVILPKFGEEVKCTLLWEHMNENLLKRFAIKGYQYKTLALLISKFENILFLDADNMPLRAPDSLFDSQVFKEKGLVLWPDVWSRTTSPMYYENIANIQVGDKPVRGQFIDQPNFNYHDVTGVVPNPTSESGMILVNKKWHSKTLLLALYYNIFGPSYYYPLFTQGGAGEGDKETFINAANVLGASYYQLDKPFTFIGYHENGFHSKALGQHDPIIDYQNSFIKDKSLRKKSELLFMHLSYPKLIPDLLIEKEELKNEETGKHRRLYAGVDLGYDFELQINEMFVQFLCLEYDGSDDIVTVISKGIGVELKQFEDRKRLQQQCRDYFIPHVKFLKENPK